MRTPLALLVGSSVLALAGAANATDLDYNFVEARLVASEVEDVDADGFRLNMSVPLTENILFLAGGSSQELDVEIDANIRTLDVGVGYVYRINEMFDFYSEARMVRVDADVTAAGLSISESGFGAAIGIRTELTESFEARANIRHIDAGDSDTLLEVGADYYVTDNIALGLTADVGGDVDSYTAGVRWFFGN